MKFVAPCLFGIEGLLSDELKNMGALNVSAQNGRVLFEGGGEMLARANICSRFAERVLICLKSFHCESFTQLYDNVRDIPLEEYIGIRDAFPIKGWSLQSKLHSVPDCQRIIKKAAVDRLSAHYHIGHFEETGPKYQLQFSLMKDEACIMLDTSGEGLHKRGYRAASAEAPIKETLAAAMVTLGRIYPDTKLYDPFCGSGTLLIEAALIANNIAPSGNRGFAAERFEFVGQTVFTRERERAMDLIKRTRDFEAFGSDIDENALQICQNNAKLASVSDCVKVKKADIKNFKIEHERALVVTNPPYGERLLDIKTAQELYKIMGRVFEKRRGLKYYIITPDEQFEELFSRRADKHRKLYNGSIKCQLYMYFKS